MNQKLISKIDFKKNLKIPKCFWFKTDEEINAILKSIRKNFIVEQDLIINDSLHQDDDEISETDLTKEDLDETIYELLFDHDKSNEIIKLLEKEAVNFNQKTKSQSRQQKTIDIILNIINEPNFDFIKNHFLVYGLIIENLKNFLAEKFKIPFVRIFDHSKRSAEISSKIFLNSRNLNAKEFLYIKPKIIYQNFCLNPTAIIKKNNKIYVIEAKLGTTQKLFNLFDFVFFEKIISDAQLFQVDCYLNALIKNVPKKPNDPQVQFLLTSATCYAEKVNNQLSKIIKYQTEFYDQIDHPKKIFYFQPKSAFDWTEIAAQISTAKPLDWSIRVIGNSFDAKSVKKNKNEPIDLTKIKTWSKRNLININNFFNKKLQLSDFNLTFLENEDLDFYDYTNNDLFFYQAFITNQWSQYDAVYKKSNANKNPNKKTKTTQEIKNKKINKKESYVNSLIIGFFDSQAVLKCREWYQIDKNLPIDFYHYLKVPEDQTTQITSDLIFSYLDDNPFNDNLLWKKIVTAFFPEANFSGTFSLTKSIINYAINFLNKEDNDLKTVNERFKNLFFEELFQNNQYAIDQAYLVSKKAANLYYEYLSFPNKVYYDFESICLPFSIMEQTYPYQQIVNQVSIIKNIDNSGIEHCQNILFDPLNLKTAMFKEIIDRIYVEPNKNAKYIVYNKSFENTRLKEMAKIINEPIYFNKIINIIENTIDLADFFDYRKTTILCQKLKGYYSIKKVINLISEQFLTQAKAISYDQIEKVRNGSICQNLCNQRYLNRINNQLWEHNAKLMKQYCENDVRVMIAAEFLIVDIMEKAIKQNKLINVESWNNLNLKKIKQQKSI
ncbi:DUF2779 domain-containing protein [[Mycoplasma] cavipharyngis]